MWCCSLERRPAGRTARSRASRRAVAVGVRVHLAQQAEAEHRVRATARGSAATSRSPPVRSASGLNGLKKSDSHRPYRSSVASVSGTICHAVCAPRSHQNGDVRRDRRTSSRTAPAGSGSTGAAGRAARPCARGRRSVASLLRDPQDHRGQAVRCAHARAASRPRRRPTGTARCVSSNRSFDRPNDVLVASRCSCPSCTSGRASRRSCRCWMWSAMSKRSEVEHHRRPFGERRVVGPLDEREQRVDGPSGSRRRSATR